MIKDGVLFDSDNLFAVYFQLILNFGLASQDGFLRWPTQIEFCELEIVAICFTD